MASSRASQPLAAPTDAQRLGSLLRDARERAGLKQRVVATEAGTSPTTLSLLERGERDVPADVLERIVSIVGADASEVFRLAGTVPPQAASDILGPEVSRAFARGGLIPASRRALRQVHLAALAAGVPPRVALPPVDPELLLFEEFAIDTRAAGDGEWGHFATYELVEYPLWFESDGNRRQRNLVLGHMAGHALIARDAGRRPACNHRAGGTGEAEATWLAGLLLMPRSMLESEAQVLAGTYLVAEPTGLASFVSEVAAAFAVPAWLAARHLGDAGLLAWSAGLEDM